MNSERSFSVLIYGAGGMVGGELLRIIAGHPRFKIAGAVSVRKAGKPLAMIHPHLRHACPDMVFISPEAARDTPADIAFTSLPHGSASESVAEILLRGIPVVDLSADFRLKDLGRYERWYGGPHPRPDMLDVAVYGLPELHRKELPGASIVSGVGCNAAASILALYPFARSGLIKEALLDVRAGSSEGGSKANQGSHHPYRSRALRIVEPFSHRHLAEVSQELSLPEENLTMRLTAVENVRGVQVCAEIFLHEHLREADLWKLFRESYAEEPFVDLCPARPMHLRFPDPRLVTGSNRVLIGFSTTGKGARCLVVVALDNLMKGSAGSAVQSANVVLGIPETTGLLMHPVYPV